MAALFENEMLSHGTVECSDLVASRRFFTEFLGLDIHRPFIEAQYIHRGGPWTVVCVCVDGGEAKDQTQANLFRLAVASRGEVDAAHAAALAHADHYGIKRIDDVATRGGLYSVRLQDLNSTWWEIAHVDLAHYDAIFDAEPAR